MRTLGRILAVLAVAFVALMVLTMIGGVGSPELLVLAVLTGVAIYFATRARKPSSTGADVGRAGSTSGRTTEATPRGTRD